MRGHTVCPVRGWWSLCRDLYSRSSYRERMGQTDWNNSKKLYRCAIHPHTLHTVTHSHTCSTHIHSHTLKYLLHNTHMTHTVTLHTHSTQESCKEDESLLNEFLSAITDLSQQFEGVAPCIIDLSPLEHVPDQEPQSIELQFEQRSCLLLSLTDSMGCVACYCNVCLL